MADIVRQLTEALPKLSPKLAHAARYAMDNPERIAFDSMRTVAATLEVAAPTMLRLARTLGFDNYEAFREEFQAHLAKPSFAGRVADLQLVGRQRQGKLIASLTEAAVENLTTTAELIDRSQVADFAKDVRRAKRTFIFGSNALYWIAGLMETTGLMALRGLRANHAHGGSTVESLASIDKADIVLALGASPYARATVEAAEFAQSKGAKVYAITDRRSAPIALHADVVFVSPTGSPHYYPSMVGFLFVAELLLAAAVANTDNLDRIRMVEQLRADSGAYIE